MLSHWSEFFQVALAHLLAVASPGPDFAVVLKQSLVHGRRTAVWTALGVGTAILLHVAYSLLGLGLLLRSSELWFAVVKYAGAAYIAWLGVQSLRARPRGDDAEPTGAGGARRSATPTARGAFGTGFLTNALNPKVTLFFVSLFVMVVNPTTPKLVQAGYGLWMAVATAAWFTLVANVFTRGDVRRSFLRHGHWIDRALGVVFLAFAVALGCSQLG
ncbi:MAG: LysE family transporter [Verrucomicrobia bacterium]|nr:LysE family transporter [Verrucomicrobiota bacterium]